MEGYPRTEYAVEVNNGGRFVRQIDVFDTYEAACEFTDKYDGELAWGEYLNIIFIDYDEDGDEVEFGTVV